MSENSVEHLLAHRLHYMLAPQVGHLLLLHFSGTREGSTMARLTIGHQLLRCVAVYARRPKIKEPNQASVVMKINKSLFDAAAEGERLGCPVIVGLPLINELVRFSLEAPCAWFRLIATWHDQEDFKTTVDLSSGMWVRKDYGQNLKPIAEANLFSDVVEHASPRSWEETVDVMKAIKLTGRGDGPSMFGGYRPLFAVCTAL